MSEELDIAFKNRILDVFENYEDTTADAGWDLLRQKFPEKKKDKVIAWWYSAAAGLLLFAGLFFMLNKKPETVTYQTNKKPKQGAIAGSQNKQIDKETPSHQKITPTAGINNAINKGLAQQIYAYKKPLLNLSGAHGDTNNAGNKVLPLGKTEVTASVIDKRNLTPVLTGITNRLTINQANRSLNTNTLQPDTIKANNDVALNQQKKPVNSVLPDKPTDPVLRMMADDKAKQAKAITTTPKEKKNKESLVALSPYAATYFNYAKGSSNQVNVGAGVTTDFKISSNFRLSTGVAIAQNTLNFDNGSVPQVAADNARAFAAATVANSSPAGAFSGNTVYNLNNYKANLVGLDIPINFKYQFNPAKSDTYISAGISSGTFINETYSSTVQYNNFFNNTATSTSQVNSNNQHFGTFDFAKTVNFSFGVGYPLGTNRLIVEPFLKYPIGGLGSQSIRFGASGVNLKFSFINSKK